MKFLDSNLEIEFVQVKLAKIRRKIFLSSAVWIHGETFPSNLDHNAVEQENLQSDKSKIKSFIGI